ncbi:MAG: carboxylate-amine ligase [Pseudomonadota bacterium]
MAAEPDFTLGVEEEYLLVDMTTGDLAQVPEAMMAACTEKLADRFSPEFLQCQAEVGTPVCASAAEAREELANLRRTLRDIANDFSLTPIAASCHPSADWQHQQFTDKDRYHALARDLAGVVRRMLICGMHVHVGLPDTALRIDIMNQFSYFLPHLLALSCSSPFWQGRDTGLGSYRLTVFDNLPRTGLPPRFDGWGQYERSVQVIIDSGLIEDSSKIWWDLRPSANFPTLETRICDVSPRLDDAVALAALVQCITRMLWRLRRKNQRWRIYDSFLIAENRWRAQRYGVTEGLIDFGEETVKPFETLIDEIYDLIAEDAEVLGCQEELKPLKTIVEGGTSSDRQRAVFAEAHAGGADETEALRAVVDHLILEFSEGL